MRILYDGSLNPNPKSGIERYFSMIVSNLPVGVEVSCSTRSSKEQLIIGSKPVGAPPLPHFRPHRVSGLLDTIFWSGRDFDLVHWMHYGPSQMGEKLRRKGVPYAITVHDLIHEIKGGPPGLLDRSARQESYNEASAILCVSNHTKKDLLDQYDVDPTKTHVIYHGSDLKKPKGICRELLEAPCYFLHVGARSGYKNFDTLLPVLCKVLNIYPDIQLRLAGPPLDTREQLEIKKHGLENLIKEEGRVDDQRLAALYANSVGLLHPSLYEGFGIPMLEAMSCGTVPIATACSSVPEVLGDTGIQVCPNNFEEGFKDAMLTLLENPLERRKNEGLCQDRASKFSWKDAAVETFRIYNKMGTT
jgi:glycosyltransferase involved in cell wall biosynthesis